jgi:hypothetical protein
MKMKSRSERILSIDEIEQRYPNEWVLVEVTKADKVQGPLFGRVLGHSRRRADLVEVNRAFCEQNPRRMTYVFFAGPIAPEGYTVMV